MVEPTSVDMTRFSFQEFVDFFFDRNVQTGSRSASCWYFNMDVEFDKPTICSFYVELFCKPEFLLTRFNKAQLEQGFWAIQGPVLDCSLAQLLEDCDVTLTDKKRCIRSMRELFAQLFARDPLESSAFMWWDTLCFDWRAGIRSRQRGGEDAELQDVLFETLTRVLAIDSEPCQKSALHGLAHLYHPQTKDLVDRFLRDHTTVSPELKEYALAASRFDVL
jgi:hypothetical protein